MIGLNEDLRRCHEAGNPVRIGLVGAGQMGIDVVATTKMMQGVQIVATVDIDIDRAVSAYKIAELDVDVEVVDSVEAADRAVGSGKRIACTDYRIVCAMKTVDVMLESTGVPDVGARAALLAAQNGQQLAMMNVETDITVGPLLNWYARQKGVFYGLAAGDEPAACKELYDFATSLGFTIVAAGKGKNNPLDRYAKPSDKKWADEAERRGLNPNMLIEFVDGSKTMIEMGSVSNATGLLPDVRGMHGPVTHRDLLNKTFALKEHGGILNKAGVVEYGIGGVHPGVFMVVTTEHPRLRQALVYRDMGNGPYYTLFRPYHLCSIEVPLTCAMLHIHKRSNMQPLDRLVSEVFAVAKQDLQSGCVLEGIGGSHYFSSIDTYETAHEEKFLPIGIAKGAELIRPVKKDSPISLSDVKLMEPSMILSLRRLQEVWMDGKLDDSSLLAEIEALTIDGI